MSSMQETGASEKLEFADQVKFFAKSIGILAAAAIIVISLATFFVWVSPNFAKWF